MCFGQGPAWMHMVNPCACGCACGCAWGGARNMFPLWRIYLMRVGGSGGLASRFAVWVFR